MDKIFSSYLALDKLYQNNKERFPDNLEMQHLILNALKFARLVESCQEAEYKMTIQNAGDIEAMELYYIVSYIAEKYQGKINQLFLKDKVITNQYLTIFLFADIIKNKTLRLVCDEKVVKEIDYK